MAEASELRIAVLGTRGFPNVQGGIERHCEQLYPRLASMGCKVRVYARKGYVAKQKRLHEGVEIYPLWTPRNRSLETIIHTLLGILHIGFNRKRFEIIHIHGIGPSLLLPLARLLGLKIIITNHGPDYDRQKWSNFAKAMLRLGEYFSMHFSSAVIAVSRHIKSNLENEYGREVFYIPNGIMLPKKLQSCETLNKYRLERKKYVLAVGRLVPEKGFHDLLEAYSTIDTHWKLVIAGGADHEDDYCKALREKAQKDSRVVLTGFITGETLTEIYSHAGFLVLPSYHEGLSITILEAMSHKLPVLASSIPANMEVIADERWTFRPGDVRALKDKLVEFIQTGSNDDIMHTIEKKIQNEFNWDRIAEQTFSVYLSTL